MDDLINEFEDGVMLCNLLEVLSEKSISFNAKPRLKLQKIDNLSRALQFLIRTEGVKLVNIGAEDIHGHNQSIILGLVWSLILKYQLSASMASTPVDTVPARSGSGGSGEAPPLVKRASTAKEVLLEWVCSLSGTCPSLPPPKKYPGAKPIPFLM